MDPVLKLHLAELFNFPPFDAHHSLFDFTVLVVWGQFVYGKDYENYYDLSSNA